jgi:hypothetical protein
MGEAMAGATKAMGAMNRRMNLPAVAKIMREFEKQNERMEMTSEMMGDAVDGVFEEGGEEEETDELVGQVGQAYLLCVCVCVWSAARSTVRRLAPWLCSCGRQPAAASGRGVAARQPASSTPFAAMCSCRCWTR